MWMFNFAYNSLCRLILLAENDSIACCIQDQLHTGILAEPVHHLLPHVAKKCRAVCSTDELHFLLLYAQRAAILNPFQIVQIKYYTLAIIKQVLVTAINVYEVVLHTWDSRMEDFLFPFQELPHLIFFCGEQSFLSRDQEIYFLDF